MSRNPQSYNITFNIQPDIKPIMRGTPMNFQSQPSQGLQPLQYDTFAGQGTMGQNTTITSNSSGLTKMTSTFAIILGMCCIFCSVCTSNADGDYSAEAEALVIDSSCSDDENNNTICVTQVKFQDRYEREFTTKIHTDSKLDKGESILVHYNPHMPQDARVAQPYNHMFSSLSFTFGLLLILFSIIIYA